MQQQLLPGLLFDKHQVASALGRSTKTIERWVLEDPSFPKPFRLKGRETWNSNDLIQWVIEEQIKDRLAALQCLDKPTHSETSGKVDDKDGLQRGKGK